MLPRLLVSEGVREPLQAEGPVDDRAQPIGLDPANHLLLLAPATYEHALQPRVLDHHEGQRQIAALAGQRANQRNASGVTNRNDRLRQRPGPSGLHYVVHALAPGEPPDRTAPLRVGFVVDGVVCTERLGTLELLVG